MNDRFLNLIQTRVHPIRIFIDKDEPITLLDPLEVPSTDITNEYRKCIDYKIQVGFHLKEIRFIISKLVESKMSISPNTKSGSLLNKSVNEYISFLKDLEDALKSIDSNYVYAISFYSRFL